MSATVAALRYRWTEFWTPDGAEAARSVAHTGVAVTDDGELLFGEPARPTIVVTAADGRVLRRLPVEGTTEVHSLTLADGLVWVADSGAKSFLEDGAIVRRAAPKGGGVLALDLDGRVRCTLDQPAGGDPWLPTSVAIDDDGVWVADGYGAGLVHRYHRDGRHRFSLDGTEGAGRFDNPHGLHVDHRHREPELYVADRKRARLQVYSPDGTFLRVVEGFEWPTHLGAFGDLLFVTDITGSRVTVLDRDDAIVAQLFPGDGNGREAWPNALAGDRVVPPQVRPEAFNSPHGVAVDSAGSLYVTEWLLGGRYVKLERLP